MGPFLKKHRQDQSNINGLAKAFSAKYLATNLRLQSKMNKKMALVPPYFQKFHGSISKNYLIPITFGHILNDVQYGKTGVLCRHQLL